MNKIFYLSDKLKIEILS